MGIRPAAATDEAIAAIEDEIGALLSRVRTNWKDTAAAVHPGLHPVGYTILAHLVHRGAMGFGEVTEQLALDKSVLSRQVRMLEEWELVQSTPDPADGRARILTATARAEDSVRAVRASNQTRFHERLREWDNAELIDFANHLRKLTSGDAEPSS